MQKWVRDKLQGLTEAFLNGTGNGQTYEAMFLCYLECLLVAQHGPSAVRGFWESWFDVCDKRTPEGQAALCLSAWITDRQELVSALKGFQQTFGKEAPPSPSKDFDILDFLSGDDL